MSCASSAATWALSLLSQSQHNTYDVIFISYVSAATRYGATRTFASRSFESSRIRNITCSASSRTGGPLPVLAPPAHPRAPPRPLSPSAPTPLPAAVPFRGSRAVIAVQSLLATCVSCSLYRRHIAAYPHLRTLLWSQTQWNYFISASFVCRKSSQWLYCNARASFSFRSAANASTAASVSRDEKSACAS